MTERLLTIIVPIPTLWTLRAPDRARLGVPPMPHIAVGRCACGRWLPECPFDAEAARGLEAFEVRRRWPRLDHVCPCGRRGVIYASKEHYVMGDW